MSTKRNELLGSSPGRTGKDEDRTMSRVEWLLQMSADFQPERPAPDALIAGALVRLQAGANPARRRAGSFFLGLVGAAGGTLCAAVLSLALTDGHFNPGMPPGAAAVGTQASQITSPVRAEEDERAAGARTGGGAVPVGSGAGEVPAATWHLEVASGQPGGLEAGFLVESREGGSEVLVTPGMIQVFGTSGAAARGTGEGTRDGR